MILEFRIPAHQQGAEDALEALDLHDAVHVSHRDGGALLIQEVQDFLFILADKGVVQLKLPAQLFPCGIYLIDALFHGVPVGKRLQLIAVTDQEGRFIGGMDFRKEALYAVICVEQSDALLRREAGDVGKYRILPFHERFLRQPRRDGLDLIAVKSVQELALEHLPERQQALVRPLNAQAVVEGRIDAPRLEQRLQLIEGIIPLRQMIEGIALPVVDVRLALLQVLQRDGIESDPGVEFLVKQHIIVGQATEQFKIRLDQPEEGVLPARDRVGDQREGVTGDLPEGNIADRAAVQRAQIG